VLPQFPVGSVCMPSMPVQLRVFEPRYLNLMGELMTSDDPVFGIPLYPQRVAPGLAPEKLSVGTLTHIDDFGMTEEFIGITGSATKRFVITSWLEPDPYPRAEVEFLPELTWDSRLESQKMLLELEVRNLLSRAQQYGESPGSADTEISDDPVAGTWQLAGILPLAPEQSHILLCSESMKDLIERSLAMCEGANRYLDSLGDEPESESER